MEAEQDPALFWRLTVREIGVILDGVTNRLKRERNDRMSLAWHNAYMTAYAPEKSRKFWKLKDLVDGKPIRRRKMTTEEMISIAHLWTAATAGRC